MDLTELEVLSRAIRWTLEIESTANPGEIIEAAAECATRLDELRRKFYRLRSVELSIAAAWTKPDIAV